jgi:hypothetical protein
LSVKAEIRNGGGTRSNLTAENAEIAEKNVEDDAPVPSLSLSLRALRTLRLNCLEVMHEEHGFRNIKKFVVMRRAAKGFGLIAWCIFVLASITATGIAAGQAIVPAAQRSRDLLAEAGADHFWIARVSTDPRDNSIGTSIVYRGKWSGNGDWTALPVIPDRVVSMGASNGELLLVLANGQWEIADDTDIRSGPTGSTWDTMLAIAGGPERRRQARRKARGADRRILRLSRSRNRRLSRRRPRG